MTNKRRADKHEAYQTLTRHGLEFENMDYLAPNAGSESYMHRLAKLCVLDIGLKNGYWVGSEVTYPDGSETDMLLWGHPERLTYVVEVETGWLDETKDKKLNQYVKGVDPVDDMLTVEVNEVPVNALEALENVSEQMGLDL